jgi:hypothetical protein
VLGILGLILGLLLAGWLATAFGHMYGLNPVGTYGNYVRP